MVLGFYPKFRITPGYNVVQNNFGIYNGSVNDSLPIPEQPFLVLNNSRVDDKFISST
jgi:hypothetical protein